KVYPSGGSMARTEGRVRSTPESGKPESTCPPSSPPSGQANRKPHWIPPSDRGPPSPPSGGPPLTPLLHATAPIRAVAAAAAAANHHRPALLMSVVAVPPARRR